MCTDKIPIQSVELEKHLKLKCQVEMNMPRIRMWKEKKKKKRQAIVRQHLVLTFFFALCLLTVSNTAVPETRAGVKSTASPRRKC